jgi:hypothetical protein
LLLIELNAPDNSGPRQPLGATAQATALQKLRQYDSRAEFYCVMKSDNKECSEKDGFKEEPKLLMRFHPDI